MLIFHYDSVDKYFLKYEDVRVNTDATFQLPAHATNVMPPEKWEKGKIPVFNDENRKWTIVKDVFWRPTLKEKLLERRFDFNLVPQLPEFDFLGKCIEDKNIILNVKCNIPKILNGELFQMRFIERLKGINIKIKKLYENDIIIKRKFATQKTGYISEDNFVKPDDLLEYKMQIEEIVHNLKKIIDDFVTAIYIKENIDVINTNHKIEFDDFGKLFSTRGDKYLDNLKKRINFDKNKDFLKTLKELHNGLKHEIFTAETDNLIGEKSPSIILLKTNKGNLSDFIQYNIYVSQLVLECKDFLLENI